jgi:hypothetical protein
MPRATRRVLESLNSGVGWAHLFIKFCPAWKRVSEDKGPRAYTDPGPVPVDREEQDELTSFRCSRARSHECTARRDLAGSQICGQRFP